VNSTSGRIIDSSLSPRYSETALSSLGLSPSVVFTLTVALSSFVTSSLFHLVYPFALQIVPQILRGSVPSKQLWSFAPDPSPMSPPPMETSNTNKLKRDI